MDRRRHLLGTFLFIIQAIAFPAAKAQTSRLSTASVSRSTSPSRPDPVSPETTPRFDVTILGAAGGLEDGNLSAYLLREHGAATGVLLDAGTVLNGIERAEQSHGFDTLPLEGKGTPAQTGTILHKVIQGYLISHAHLDHVAGLVIVSPDDPGKPVYALPSVNAALEDNLFNHRIWPNLGDRGVKPAFGLLHYRDLAVGQMMDLAHTGLTVTAYPLSHGGVESTAFLVHSGKDALLYLGDTGPDNVEHSHRLEALWQDVAPLVRAGRLRGIIIECSYDNRQPDSRLYGHLTPRWLLQELGVLRDHAGVSMKGFPVLVSHIKPTLDDNGAVRTTIARELAEGNRDGFRFILAEQGRALSF
ncbi:MBL fold metallo-hydrolase [Asaia krungthepensis]|nr:3',5'-cyclic-nucleotide phosphodiesterase [Asaia krungthepensis]